MHNFWLRVALVWGIWVLRNTLIWSFVMVVFTMGALYLYQGMPDLSEEIELFFKHMMILATLFWGSLALLLHLFLSFRKLFYFQYGEYRLKLLNCSKDEIKKPALRDVIKFWRNWLFRLLWFYMAILIVLMTLKVFDVISSTYAWFNGWIIIATIFFMGGYLLKPAVLNHTNVRIVKEKV